MPRLQKAVYVAFALLGIAGLVLKPQYHGPLRPSVIAYGGNFTVSFALYFVAVIGATSVGLGRVAAAAMTLAAVTAFEATNGFGVMANVYDRGDFVANAAGIVLAIVVEFVVRRLLASAVDQDTPFV